MWSGASMPIIDRHRLDFYRKCSKFAETGSTRPNSRSTYHSNELELLISRVNDSRPVKGYSLLLRSRPLSAPAPSFFLSSWKRGTLRKVSRTQSAGSQERGGRPTSGENGGRTAKLVRLARDEGLITTLEEYLRATVCVFHPRPSFLSFVTMPVFPFSCLPLSPFLSRS